MPTEPLPLNARIAQAAIPDLELVVTRLMSGFRVTEGVVYAALIELLEAQQASYRRECARRN